MYIVTKLSDYLNSGCEVKIKFVSMNKEDCKQFIMNDTGAVINTLIKNGYKKEDIVTSDYLDTHGTGYNPSFLIGIHDMDDRDIWEIHEV